MKASLSISNLSEWWKNAGKESSWKDFIKSVSLSFFFFSVVGVIGPDLIKFQEV